MSICLVKQNDETWVEKHQCFLINVYKRFFYFCHVFLCFYFFWNVFLHLWLRLDHSSHCTTALTWTPEGTRKVGRRKTTWRKQWKKKENNWDGHHGAKPARKHRTEAIDVIVSRPATAAFSFSATVSPSSYFFFYNYYQGAPGHGKSWKMMIKCHGIFTTARSSSVKVTRLHL